MIEIKNYENYVTIRNEMAKLSGFDALVVDHKDGKITVLCESWPGCDADIPAITSILSECLPIGVSFSVHMARELLSDSKPDKICVQCNVATSSNKCTYCLTGRL